MAKQEIAAAAGEPLSAAIQAHLEECADCRSLAATCRGLAGQAAKARDADQACACLPRGTAMRTFRKCF